MAARRAGPERDASARCSSATTKAKTARWSFGTRRASAAACAARDLEYLDRALAELARPTSPFATGTPPKGVRFVEPQLVVDVQFTEWTNSGGLRAPVFLGYRTDKPAAEVERERPA